MESPAHIKWKILTTEGVECEHIYYHQLQPEDSLTDIAARHKKSLTVAVILGNINSSLELPAKFSEGIKKQKKNAFPMILVSAEDGACLKDFLNRHDSGELLAKIEPKGQTRVDMMSAQGGAGSRGSYSPEVQPKKLKPSESGRHV